MGSDVQIDNMLNFQFICWSGKVLRWFLSVAQRIPTVTISVPLACENKPVHVYNKEISLKLNEINDRVFF